MLARAAGSLILLPPLVAQFGWVAETANFRVLVEHDEGLNATVAETTARDLELTRRQFESEGFGTPQRADGPAEFLVVADRHRLREILRDPPSSRTRGITIRGTDRDLAIVPWHDPTGPRIILAHEYAHQIEDRDWPLWFREGRAVYLARRPSSRSDVDPVRGLVDLLERPAWTPWADLLTARRDEPVISEGHFQAQSWLLVRWLAERNGGLTSLDPDQAELALAAMGEQALSDALRASLRLQVGLLPAWWDAVTQSGDAPRVRSAEEWEFPLFEGEVHRELRRFDAAEARLSDLAERYQRVARVQAGYATLCLLRGRQQEAETHYGRAIALGDSRARTAYRYAVLLMRPGPQPEERAKRALRFAALARDAMPREPSHQLAVAHARMLDEDWQGAFDDLRSLAAFPGWAARATREALEVERRRGESMRRTVPPDLVADAPATVMPTTTRPQAPPPWQRQPDAPATPPDQDKWPPDGAWVTFGRFGWVDCTGPEKRVIVHSPYRRYVFREDPARPPRLINRPFLPNALPCGLRGWKVAVAYRKLPKSQELDGELVGVRF